MKAILRRIVIFWVPFTIVFWLIHDNFEAAISRSTVSGLGEFYSTAGVIFGLVTAFVIQREWENWTNLSEAVRTELDTIREMWKWSNYAAVPLCEQAHKHLEGYLKAIDTEWGRTGEMKRSSEIDAELEGLRNMLIHMSSTMDGLGLQMQGAFANLVQARNLRLNFSNEHMPAILKRIIFLATTLLIFLSLGVAVNDIILDYVFTGSIGLLAFSLYQVVDDLDNPFRPGEWHVTTQGYTELFAELTAK